MAWAPLESNPDVMTKYLHNVGVSSKWSISDIFGLDDEILNYVQKPVKAIIFLYPLTENVSKIHLF